jgi:crossover junction endodeoxyribonuclease RuvC
VTVGSLLAVDIGAHGAAALLDDAGDLLDVVDLPTLDSGPACRPEISPHLFAAIVRRWAPSRAWVEWIGPRQGDRPSGAFSFGASKATVETTLAVLGVPYRTITPAVWKRAAGIPAGRGMKDLARARAIERWPDRAETFARVKDHDRAEAALIGWAAIMRERMGR